MEVELGFNASGIIFVLVPIIILAGIIIAGLILKPKIIDFMNKINDKIETMVENMKLLTEANLEIARHVIPQDEEETTGTGGRDKHGHFIKGSQEVKDLSKQANDAQAKKRRGRKPAKGKKVKAEKKTEEETETGGQDEE